MPNGAGAIVGYAAATHLRNLLNRWSTQYSIHYTITAVEHRGERWEKLTFSESTHTTLFGLTWDTRGEPYLTPGRSIV